MSLVSVVVAARNEAPRIERCVRSLLGQTGVDLEIIVIDDGSTDGTFDVLARIDDERLVVLRNESSQGRGAARNRAVGVARGDILAIQDADDVALPGKLATLAAMLEDRSLVAVGGQCIARTTGGRYWLHTHFPLTPSEISARLDSGVMGVCHTASAMRREAVDAVGGYSADFPRAQDLELFRRLLARGAMRNTDKPLVVYLHPVLLSWRYWSSTRASERRMTGAGTPPLALQAIRYAAANLRRVLRFIRSTRRAGRLIDELTRDAPSVPTAPQTS